MFAQIGNWIELNFWQLAVQALSKVRPLSAQVLRAAHGFAVQPPIGLRPLSRVLRSGWVIAAGGWLLGLILGFLFAIR